MTSERIQRRIESLLDQVEQAGMHGEADQPAIADHARGGIAPQMRAGQRMAQDRGILADDKQIEEEKKNTYRGKKASRNYHND